MTRQGKHPKSSSPVGPESADATSAFRDFLRDRGIKLTSPRRRILETVLGMDEHFEAEQVLFALRSQGERVAKATIYRTLPLLVECGILKQVRFDVKQSHYRVCFGDAPRDNMVCRNCGRIIEFSSEDLTRLRDRLARKHQFQPLSHRLQISGFCQECAKGKR